MTPAGFNRGNNNRTNTFAAVADAKKSPGLLEHLRGVEIGNEPDGEHLPTALSGPLLIH